jgi:hypothetical protein
MLAAPQLLPMAALLAGSTAASGLDVNGFGGLSWGDRSILAGAFSSTRSETAPIYLGAVGLGQALVGLVSGWMRRPVQVILGLAALSLIWSFGLVGLLVSPLAPSLATVTAHQPVRALPLTVLALALGVGMFWDQAVTVRRCLVAIVGSAGGFLVAGTIGPTSREAFLLSAGLGVAVLFVALRWRRAAWPLILAAVVLSVDLAIHNVGLRNTHQPPAVWQSASTLYPAAPSSATALRQLGVGIAGARFAWVAPPRVRGHQLGRALSPEGRELLLPGGSMRYLLPTVGGYNPVIDRTFSEVMQRSNGRAIPDRHNLYVIRAPTDILRAYSVGAYLCLRTSCPSGLPIRWRGAHNRIVTDPLRLPFARIAIHNHSQQIQRLTAAWPSSDEISVRPSHTASGGRITVAERFAPGWNVSVDGVVRPLSHAVFGLMSVEVKRGWRRVQFAYEPPGFRYGIAIALCAALICCQRPLRRLLRHADRRLRR